MCALPFTASAKPIGLFDFVVKDPGDQVDPSIDGQFVIYAGPGPAGAGIDVLVRDIELQTTKTVAGGPGDQDSPDVHSSAAAFRTPEGIGIYFMGNGATLLVPSGGADVGNPAIGFAVAAWESRAGGDLDVVVSRYRTGTPYVLQAPGGGAPAGDQHAPAAYGDLVAYVDEARQGSVWVHDSIAGPSSRSLVCDGRASGVSLGFDGTQPVAAVARSPNGQDEDIEIYGLDGSLLAALPVAGPQRNPHVSGEWVAFEDYSTGFSQVVVWRWKTPPGEGRLVFVPHPSETQQVLNDLTMAASEQVRVVFEDTYSEATGRDIALYRLDVDPIEFDDQPNGFPPGDEEEPPPRASCADLAGATVLATLELAREEGKPKAGSRTFTATPPAGKDELPVVVCVHAERVSAAWVALDDEAIATPSDFEPHVVDLELPAEVEDGLGRISGVIAGKPGARLTVTVIADPGREAGALDAAGTGDPADAAAGAVDPLARPSGGCGSGGAGGIASLAALALVLARPSTSRRGACREPGRKAPPRSGRAGVPGSRPVV